MTENVDRHGKASHAVGSTDTRAAWHRPVVQRLRLGDNTDGGPGEGLVEDPASYQPGGS